MTVGETLTEARAQAGLSVDELSERTRIRGTVIQSIEQDDYEACGGDLYVRGYVRALAGAVGIDAQPLIREFDSGRATSAGNPAGRYASAPSSAAAATTPDLPAVADTTRFDLPAVSADPAATAYDLPEVPATAEFPTSAPPYSATETRFDLPPLPEDLRADEPRTDDLVAAGYDFTPAAPAEADSATKVIPAVATGQASTGPASPPAGAVATPQAGLPQASPGQGGIHQAATARTSRGRGKRRGLIALAVVAVLAVAGGVGTYLATSGNSGKNAASAAPDPSAVAAARASAAAKASAAAQASASAQASAAAAASASAQASASAAAQARARAIAQRVITLPVTSVASFGPDGFSDGDNPGNAQDAIARNPAAPWQSQWYATPDFGMLKHGTGLLLNLGGKVTVTSVRLDLGQFQSANVQIRIGNGMALQNLSVAGAASNAGGPVKFTLRHPVAAKYLLIWFTQLPPDGLGHYQASVSHVVVSGRR